MLYKIEPAISSQSYGQSMTSYREVIWPFLKMTFLWVATSIPKAASHSRFYCCVSTALTSRPYQWLPATMGQVPHMAYN